MLALLFPGQGSQFVGMGRDAFEASAAARATFEAADDALGFSISGLCFDGPEDQLQLTENQQPAILTTSIALLRALEEQVEPGAAYLAGHSLGEYSALVAAQALSFEAAVRLVHARGRFMQEAMPSGLGAMAALIGCTPEIAMEACNTVAQATGDVVAPANFNSPQQTVIAGLASAVAQACEKALELGAKRAVSLPVSAPFHCSLMEPAAEKLADELSAVDFRDAAIPVVSNVEAAPNSDARALPGLLRAQVTAPVRFTDMIANLTSLGVDRYLEVGPGRVLAGLLARISRRTKKANLGSIEDLPEAVAFVAETGA
ncbi:MAG: ACP S-malonyltransferase [Myxococcales bacterium]|nr:ACP S-malonyltransferase [Myxococcales bacterium]